MDDVLVLGWDADDEAFLYADVDVLVLIGWDGCCGIPGMRMGEGPGGREAGIIEGSGGRMIASVMISVR